MPLPTNIVPQEQHQRFALSAPNGQQLRRALIVYLAALAILWAIGLAGAYARSRVMHVANPLDCLWVYDGTDGHMDILGYNTKLHGFGPTGIIVYPAPMMAVFRFLTGVTSHPVELYTTFIVTLGIVVATLFAVTVYRRSLTNRALVVAAAASSIIFNYIIWFVMERSNLEAFVWFAVLISSAALIGRWYKTAALFVAVAAAMKLYPGILMLVFLKEKKYRSLLLCCVFFAAINVFGLWVSNPDILAANRQVTSGLLLLNKGHISGFLPKEVAFDHSFFSPVKQGISILNRRLFASDKERFNEKVAAAVRVYTPIAVLAFAISYILWIRKLAVTNQVAVLLILCITLPMMSLEYTLLEVFPVFAILILFMIDSTNRGLPLPSGWIHAALISFAVVITPFTWLGGRTVGYDGQIKLAALVVMLILALRFPLESLDRSSAPNAA